MECCQCQQERQKYLKQICGERREAVPWGRGFQASLLPPQFWQPTPAQRVFEVEGGNSSNTAGGHVVLSFHPWKKV